MMVAVVTASGDALLSWSITSADSKASAAAAAAAAATAAGSACYLVIIMYPK